MIKMVDPLANPLRIIAVSAEWTLHLLCLMQRPKGHPLSIFLQFQLLVVRSGLRIATHILYGLRRSEYNLPLGFVFPQLPSRWSADELAALSQNSSRVLLSGPRSNEVADT